MRQTLQNFGLFIVLTSLAAAIFWAGDKWVWPPPPKPPKPPKPLTVKKEMVGAMAGGGILVAPPFDKLAALPPPPPPQPPKPVVAKPAQPRTLIALGDDSFFLKVLLTDKGAGVQQVVLTQFDEANRLGREVRDDGKPRPLHLIPGYVRPWRPELKFEPEFYALAANLTAADHAAGVAPGPLSVPENKLSKPSYVLLHYPSRDDPVRRLGPDGLAIGEDDNFPLADLGERHWRIATIEQPTAGPWKVVFEAELDFPYYVKLRKIFTLAPKDYDFKLSVEIEPLEKRAKGVGQLRYQIAGPLGMPIEGEWYTATYRTAYTIWTDGNGHQRRAVDDPSSIHYMAGSPAHRRNGTFNAAAVGTQFFASALAVDMPATEKDQPWEYVRATRERLPGNKDEQVEYESEKAFLYDVTFRAVTAPVDPQPGETIRHDYAVYNGPIKVRLLRQLAGARAVDPGLVDRYMDTFHLDMLTDYHSPNWFSRQANKLFWTDLVIAATNVLHSLLGFLHGLVGSWGLSIVLMTMIVKLCLFIPSRRQQAINVNMQARIATIKPELDELKEKYGDNFMLMSQEKAKLFKKAGIRHSAQLGGCLLLLLQMPILMGLYFCLQESVFFRLESFLWMPNLAAPDMLAWWGEGIPLISDPSNRFGSFSFFYLGPFFNLLPIAAVSLFYIQQKLTMPPPTDEMMETQYKMMKYMLAFSALFFYKIAAGLCVYFIVSGLWSLAERRLIPKPKPEEIKPPSEEQPKPQGWLARKIADAKERMEELQKQAEHQRQIRNQPQANAEPMTRNERRASKKKKR